MSESKTQTSSSRPSAATGAAAEPECGFVVSYASYEGSKIEMPVEQLSGIITAMNAVFVRLTAETCPDRTLPVFRAEPEEGDEPSGVQCAFTFRLPLPTPGTGVMRPVSTPADLVRRFADILTAAVADEEVTLPPAGLSAKLEKIVSPVTDGQAAKLIVMTESGEELAEVDEDAAYGALAFAEEAEPETDLIRDVRLEIVKADFTDPEGWCVTYRETPIPVFVTDLDFLEKLQSHRWRFGHGDALRADLRLDDSEIDEGLLRYDAVRIRAVETPTFTTQCGSAA